jgi:DNA-binding transcriptional LysR family regulator
MELRNLKYLVSLEEQGSFTAAAAVNFVTQPAVSIQLKKLQEELGMRLFETKGRKVRFTEAGRTVLRYARRYINLESQLMREMNDLQGLRKGRLSLGMIDAASIYVLPGIFAKFHELYPGIDVNLEVSSTIPLLSGLENGTLDIVVGSLPLTGYDRVEVFPIYREALVPIAPPGHFLSRQNEVDPADLVGHSFISFHKESVTRRIIEDALERIGIRLEITMAIDSQEAIRNLVASGFGLSILPEWTVNEHIKKGTVARLNVKGLKMERRLGLIVPAGRYISSTVQAFLRVLRKGLGIDLPDRLCGKGDEKK